MSDFDEMANRLYDRLPDGSTRPPAPADKSGVLPADDKLAAMAERIYPPSPIPGVNFDEPKQGTAEALANTQRLPVDAADSGPGLATVRNALHKLGFGLTQSSALWDISLAARNSPGQLSPDQAMAELRKTYGDKAPAKIAAAKALFAELRQQWSGADAWIRQVGNDPRVTIIFAERAARRK